MVNNNSDCERGNPLPPHGLLLPISSKFFYMHHPTVRIAHTTYQSWSTGFKHGVLSILTFILSQWIFKTLLIFSDSENWTQYVPHVLLMAYALHQFELRGKSVRSWCDGSSDRSFMGWTHWAISRSRQCSTTGVTKAVVCAILSVGWCM